MKIKQSQGFTLVELMVVVAIMAIMAAIAMPSMSAFIAQSRVNNRAQQIAVLLRYAKGEAIRMNVPVVICGDTIRRDGRPSGVCNDDVFDTSKADARRSALKAFADKDKDGQYNSNNGDIDLRTISINGNTDRSTVGMTLLYCPVGGENCEKAGAGKKEDSQTNNDKKAEQGLIFLPDGRFGIKNGKTLSDARLLTNRVQLIIKDANRLADMSRWKAVVIHPSGSVQVCAVSGGETTLQCQS